MGLLEFQLKIWRKLMKCLEVKKMQNDVSIATSEKDLNVKYGLYNLGPEREAARGSLKYILTDLNDIRKSFIRLGFHLNEMLCNKYYQDFGYPTIEEFAEANLGMDKSNVYRYIRVFENFAAENGYHQQTLYLDDKWKDYSFSQLVEMCSMSKVQRQACKPDMTIKQIREVKKTVPKNADALIDSLKDIISGSKDQQDQIEKVATSPLEKEKKKLDYGKYMSLTGAARDAYIKSCDPIHGAFIHVYDSNGKRVDLEPVITNIWIELLYCYNGHYVFRLNQPVAYY